LSVAGLHEQFDRLIKSGKALLPYQNNAEYLARKKKWQVQCVALLERAFGKDNAYVKEFQGVQNYGNRDFHIIDGSAIMEGAKEDLDYSYKSEKLEKIRRKVQEEKAEAERRAAVAETKQLGSFIEVIDMLREELKRRNQLNLEITNIHKEIGEMKSILNEIKDSLKKA
jgi:hypothetical protein